MKPKAMLMKFLADPDAYDMYVTGRAGTGKTTAVAVLVDHLEATGVTYIVCAYTHKACDVLRAKLPTGAMVTTLHSYLRKRPTINVHALKAAHIEGSKQMAVASDVKVLIVDEYSIVGEKDYMDIVALQDSEDGHCKMKVVYVGDKYQLPPVKDLQTIDPDGKYVLTLSKIHRTDNTDLLDAMGALVQYIDNPKLAKPLGSSEHLIRNIDICAEYAHVDSGSKCILAFTNRAVERINSTIEGSAFPRVGDRLVSPCLHTFFSLTAVLSPREVLSIHTHSGQLGQVDKFDTLKYLLRMPGLTYYSLKCEDTRQDITLACVFGHYQYKLRLSELQSAATTANKAIETRHGINAATWARANPKKPLARRRASAWRDYLVFKQCVMCVDFTHAMTVHKSQGSTFEHVFIDTEDLSICMEQNFTMYLRLFYVAISRASVCVYTN